MSPPARTRLATLSLAAGALAASLLLAALARGQASPAPGGTVPSVLGLSLSGPGGFTRSGRGGVFTATIRAEATATDTPTQLSLVDGEETAGPRLGHLVRGSSILSPALSAAANGGSYRPLDAAPPQSLLRWSEPVAHARAKIRLRQVAPDARALRGHHKLLLVTLTAAGP